MYRPHQGTGLRELSHSVASKKACAAAGEIGTSPTPKEQPPRKLSGKRTANRYKLLERDTHKVSADGITISGKHTEGAHEEAEPSAPRGVRPW